MLGNITIETNAEALRSVSALIKEFGCAQLQILDDYFNQMQQLLPCLETRRYQEFLAKIEYDKQSIADLFYLGCTPFASFLIEKANMLDTPVIISFKNVSPISSTSQMGSTSPFDSHAFPDYPYLDSLSPLPNLPPEQVPFDVTAFKDGEYRTYEVSKPLVGYRYFGSYESPGADDFIAQNYISQSASSTQCSGWGSDAIGRWVSPIRSNDANFVKNALALKQLWGNDAEYVSKLEIPPGTILSVGIAAPQGSLEGGGTQIFIHTIYDADPTLSPEEKERLNDQFFRDNICWVKKCEPISTFNFSD